MTHTYLVALMNYRYLDDGDYESEIETILESGIKTRAEADEIMAGYEAQGIRDVKVMMEGFFNE